MRPFPLGEDIDLLREAVRAFVDKEIAPRADLIDRENGIGCATTTWESRAAMEASRADADTLRARAATDSGGQILDVHEFVLVHAHLHVPEMA